MENTEQTTQDTNTNVLPEESSKDEPKPVLRQVYKRNGIIHMCWKGEYFGPEGKTSLKHGDLIHVTLVDDANLHVKETDEVWSPVTVPTGPARGKKAQKES